MATYRCNNCNTSVSRDASKCPGCGLLLVGIKCEGCKFSGGRDDFQGDRCPKCGKATATAASKPLTPAETKGCLIGCAVLATLLVVGCGGLTIFAMGLRQKEMAGVRVEAEKVLRLLGEGKAGDAYAGAALAYRAETDEATFQAALKDLDLVGYTRWEEKSVDDQRAPDTVWTLEGYVVARGGRVVPLTMDFVQENEKWRLRSIRRTPPPAAAPPAAATVKAPPGKPPATPK